MSNCRQDSVNLISLVNLEDTLYFIINNEGLKELEALCVDYSQGMLQISKNNILAKPATIKEIVGILNENNWVIDEEFSAILY